MTESKLDEIQIEEFRSDIEALQYAGFTPSITRAVAINRLGKKAVIRALIAYIMAGNNLEKMDIQRMDSDHARQIKLSLRELGIANRGSPLGSVETLTLSRIAMAFSPALLIVRSYFKSFLQVRIQKSLDVVYQDISLSNISLMLDFPSSYDVFLEAFGQMINPGSDNQGMYTDLARANAEMDPYFGSCVEELKSSEWDAQSPDEELTNELLKSFIREA